MPNTCKKVYPLFTLGYVRRYRPVLGELEFESIIPTSLRPFEN